MRASVGSLIGSPKARRRVGKVPVADTTTTRTCGCPALERAFMTLSEPLARRGVVADVFVVGAAMALAYHVGQAD